MKIRWIVENFVGDNGYEELIEEIRKQGMECTVLDITNHFELKTGLIKDDELIIFQGSIQLFRKLKEELSCKPMGWMTDSNYLCSNYYPHFQKYLFNDKHVFTTVSGLKHNKFWFYSIFGKEALIYVRPDGGDKTFTGQLIDLQDFDKFFSSGTRCSAKDTDMVVVSSPKNILGEWRFICTNEKEIIAMSCYQYQGQRTYIPSAPVEATKLCKEILSVGWYPDPFFTIDICQDSDKNFWMIEMNSFTCAGMYGANKELIVKRVSEIVSKKSSVTNMICDGLIGRF
jgi:hypothetical protein